MALMLWKLMLRLRSYRKIRFKKNGWNSEHQRPSSRHAPATDAATWRAWSGVVWERNIMGFQSVSRRFIDWLSKSENWLQFYWVWWILFAIIFRTILRPLWDHFGTILRPLWDHILEPFYDHFGTILEQFRVILGSCSHVAQRYTVAPLFKSFMTR